MNVFEARDAHVVAHNHAHLVINACGHSADTLEKEAQRLYQLGCHHMGIPDMALPFFAECERVQRQIPNNNHDVAQTIIMRAGIMNTLRQYDVALILFKQAEECYAPDRMMGRAVQFQGDTLLYMHRDAEAEVEYERARQFGDID